MCTTSRNPNRSRKIGRARRRGAALRTSKSRSILDMRNRAEERRYKREQRGPVCFRSVAITGAGKGGVSPSASGNETTVKNPSRFLGAGNNDSTEGEERGVALGFRS